MQAGSFHHGRRRGRPVRLRARGPPYRDPTRSACVPCARALVRGSDRGFGPPRLGHDAERRSAASPDGRALAFVAPAPDAAGHAPLVASAPASAVAHLAAVPRASIVRRGAAAAPAGRPRRETPARAHPAEAERSRRACARACGRSRGPACGSGKRARSGVGLGSADGPHADGASPGRRDRHHPRSPGERLGDAAGAAAGDSSPRLRLHEEGFRAPRAGRGRASAVGPSAVGPSAGCGFGRAWAFNASAKRVLGPAATSAACAGVARPASRLEGAGSRGGSRP
jgi:hypothetical protein